MNDDTHIAYIDSPVGWLKLVEENNIITRIHFMDETPDKQENIFSPLLQQCADELHAYFDGELQSFSILNNSAQRGTGFQQRVWSELVKIPFGKTISYRELSIRLGDEKNIRAAASANGQNNLVIAVPCHRVIGSDGSLIGFGGGLWRKRWLLDHEAKWSGRPVQTAFEF